MSEITKKDDGHLTEERLFKLRTQMKGRNFIIVLLKIIPWMNG
jgi:hypothetical protein